MTNKVKIIQYGVGEMGAEAVRQTLEKRDLELVGCIDKYTGVGMDVGKVVGLDRDIGIKVSDNAEEVYKTVKAEVLVHCAVSEVKGTFQQTKRAMENGMNVITIAERCAYPWITEPQLAEEIDKVAKNNRVSFLGTGINPGIRFDYLPIVLTGMMKKVSKVNLLVRADWTNYGKIPWDHAGIGRTIEDFNAGRDKGDIVLHVGFAESSRLIAKALGWKINDYNETSEPRISTFRRETKWGIIEAGTVCGFKQTGHSFVNGKEVITAEVEGIARPTKEDNFEIGTFYSIDGIAGIKVEIKGEFVNQGGWATAAHAINSIPQVIAARSGLITVEELPPSSCLP